MVECLAEVREPDPGLRPGFYATAAVETRTARAVAVPESALQPSEQGWIAWVVDGDKARLRRVSVGLRTRAGLAEILDGLAEGDVLVVRGGRVLHEGAVVSARAAKPGGSDAKAGAPAPPTPDAAPSPDAPPAMDAPPNPASPPTPAGGGR